MNHKLRFNANGNGTFGQNGKSVRYETKARRKTVKPKTDNQRRYMEAIESCDIIFCLGPAGTGKTHIAAGMAAKLYLADEVRKLKIARPAVEAGDSLGYLPGDLDDKIDPYLRPILEELEDFLGVEDLKKLRQGDCPVVEFSVLQYLRGSNFKDAVVILDEAQNATFKQLDMFLKRLSYGAKLIINGDPSQSDLPSAERGALVHFSDLYGDFDEVRIIVMTEEDSVRHPLVTKMLLRDREG
jgi:phosphate starvation-inducible PhoH-like protein